MSIFPSRIFDGDGLALDGRPGNLTQDRINACAHRCVVAKNSSAPIWRVWLLTNAAAFNTIPVALVEGAAMAIDHGQGFLLLADQPKPLHDVRAELLDCWEIYDDLSAKA